MSHLECNENTNLTSTGGETRKIYSFSYYCSDGDSGAIGSNGVLRCSKVVDAFGIWIPREGAPPNAHDLYAGVVNNNSWAEKLAHFINKVIAATGASKVDIVAYSMGGLVARAAMKYYGSAGKVRKLLMIGTPNHPYQHSFGEWIYDLVSHDKKWQGHGEDLEMDVDVATGSNGINFETSDPESDAPWCDHLGYENQGVQMATIAGNKGWSGFPPNDKMVAVSQVKMGSSAEFEPTIYASHSYDGDPELALTTCTYTTEFIKKWMIDDDVSHNGVVVAGAFAAYDSMPINGKYYNCNAFNPIGYLHYGARYLCLANCPDTDTLYSRNPGGDKTGAIILEFLGASLGQAGLGFAIPYVVARATSPDHNMGSTLQSVITYLILYSVGVPIGSATGCLITGRLLGEPSKSFG